MTQAWSSVTTVTIHRGEAYIAVPAKPEQKSYLTKGQPLYQGCCDRALP